MLFQVSAEKVRFKISIGSFLLSIIMAYMPFSREH